MFDGLRLVFINKAFINSFIEKYESIIEIETVLHYGAIKYQKAKYKSLVIKMNPSGRVEIRGSLHKYFNDGKHNYDDFTIQNVNEVIALLKAEFGMNPNNTIVDNLEFGVNIKTHFNPKDFLNALIRFKSKQFSIMKTIGQGDGRECYSNQYGVKIYDKGFQNFLDYYILRIEKKIIKMNALKYKKPMYLIDLLDIKLWEHCKRELLSVLNELTVNDNICISQLMITEQSVYNDVISQSRWAELSKYQRCRRKKTFDEIISKYGSENYIQNIIPLVNDKCNELLNKGATF
jgi:hypothetical protein